MKAILLIIGITGIVATNANAQDKKCVCVNKTVHHPTTHHKASSVTVTSKKTKHTGYVYKPGQKVKLDNLASARKCAIDTNGEIQYFSNDTYSGYYPGNDVSCDADAQLVPRFKSLIVTSSAFSNNGVLPSKYSCHGQQVSPPLKVTNIPPGTTSLAIVMFDPHATAKKSTTYWLMWNLDPNGDIPENFVSDFESQNPINKQYGYQAVCPLNGTHYYHFRVYALDTRMLLDKHATKATMENAMQGHVLAKGELVAQYNPHLE